MKFNKKSKVDPKIPDASLPDIVFMLLIFFMVASHMSKMDRTPVELPVANKSTIPESARGRQLITIRSHDRSGEKVDILVNLKNVDMEQVEPIIRSALAKDADAVVYLRADRYAKHKHVKAVMAACAEGGVANVIFATFESGN